MKQLRPYLLAFVIVLPVIILVLIRSFALGNFKPDANKLAEASFTGANLLNTDQVAALHGKPLIIKLVNPDASPAISSSDTLFVAAGRLLEKDNLKTIHAYHGAVVLVSDDPAVSGKAWMILSQMGYRNLFVLIKNPDIEVLKYKFRSDTSAGI